MTIQEEIREGIAIRLHTQDRAILRIVNEISPCNCSWEELEIAWKESYRDTADLFIKFLHSQGVVIKVNDHYEELIDA